jgi:type II secretory pathway component GspD/PulD (secretin)
MTHGDKAKAKTGKSSQTSAKKVSAKAGPESSGSKAGKDDQSASAKKQQAGGEKSGPAQKSGGSSKAVPAAAASDVKGKARPAAPAPAGDGSGFTNAIVGSGFKRALKKYPNALRKLTD